jgi:hypothetical protein
MSEYGPSHDPSKLGKFAPKVDPGAELQMLGPVPGPSPSFTAFMDFLLEDIARATGITLSDVSFIRSMPHPSDRWKN